MLEDFRAIGFHILNLSESVLRAEAGIHLLELKEGHGHLCLIVLAHLLKSEVNGALFDLMKELMQRVQLHAHVLVDEEERDLEDGEAKLKVVHRVILRLIALKAVREDTLNLVVFLILLELLEHLLVIKLDLIV